jgi:hypothetical protein
MVLSGDKSQNRYSSDAGSRDSWLFFLIPAQINFGTAGLDETKNRAERGVLRLIQIRLATASLKKSS